MMERERAELVRRESEMRIRSLGDNLPGGMIYQLDMEADGKERRFTYIRAGVEKLHEVTAAAVLEDADVLYRQIVPADRPIIIAREAEALAGMKPFRAEMRSQLPSGHVRWNLVTSAPRRAANGHIIWDGVELDITERKQADDALRASEERFRLLNLELEQRVSLRTDELAASNREIQALLDSIPDTVLLCDGSGTVISSSSPADQPGLNRSARGPSDAPPDPVGQEIAQAIIPSARSSGQTVVQEFDRQLNGASVSIEARATRVGPDRVLILLRDITARKRTERDVLAHLERERQLSEMKSQFITVASHEFRTPLATAVGSVELLERHSGRLPEAKRGELLTRVRLALGRLTSIMDDMLMLSRADSGRVEVKRMAIDLGRFVADVVHNSAAADQQQHVFSFHLVGKDGPMPADTNLLHHILSNLIENAVRYSPAGTRISVVLDIDEQSFALTVTDEGIGVPEGERERIFEPFVRGSNVDQVGGTGLGLNLAKRYAELMGGRIELLPTGRGAAFRVSVPFHQPTVLK
jgi:signal transduction histidine kinase